ncbi:MAG: hypothetical protein ACFB5Z_14315 [Elainellaceae cyanobacterium]
MNEPLYARPFPSTQSVTNESDLQAAWATYQFHQEVRSRQAFEAYCQRYRQTAERHQQELAQMSGDINILGWFSRE